MEDTSVKVCPGCGGRNIAQAETCDWCGRPFAERKRSFLIRRWQLVGSLLVAAAVAAVLGLAILNGGRLAALSADARSVVQSVPTPTGPPATARPTDAAADAAPTPQPATAPAGGGGAGVTAAKPTTTPRTAAKPTAAPQPEPDPEPEPEPASYVRVANTNGLGVNLRQEPGPRAEPVIAVAENTVLKVVGPEETVQEQRWRLCEHEERGVQGWVPAEFLQEAEASPAQEPE